MRIANRFAIAVHILSFIEMDESGNHTSEWMAGSIGVNAVIVRNITGMLRRAGLVSTHQGRAGIELTRPLSQITLLDVYRSVEEEGELFSIHPRPNPQCTVGANIQGALEQAFGDAQEVMENKLQQTTIADIVREMRTSARQRALAPV